MYDFSVSLDLIIHTPTHFAQDVLVSVKSKLDALGPSIADLDALRLKERWDLILDLPTYEKFVSDIRETLFPADLLVREISMVIAKLIVAVAVSIFTFLC